jgi:hypothetical protein
LAELKFELLRKTANQKSKRRHHKYHFLAWFEFKQLSKNMPIFLRQGDQKGDGQHEHPFRVAEGEQTP